jgi:pyrroloquinoline quinone biosynthesis protein B
MKFIILGAAAGGGLPQWNCGCQNCASAREGRLAAQTQSSLAITCDGDSWAILDASPDVRQQLERCKALHPHNIRDTPIKAVLVTNGDIDHLVGLLTLRERQVFDLFVTVEIADVIKQNPIFDVLQPLVRQHIVALEAPFCLLPGLTVRVFAVPGKIPLYMERDLTAIEAEDGHTIGVEIEAIGSRAYYIPGCRELSPALVERLRAAEVLFFDGTLYQNDELRSLGISTKTGLRMGHMPIGGDSGSLKRLAALNPTRKIYVHINNTNPIWCQGPERGEVISNGFEVGADGMEIEIASHS